MAGTRARALGLAVLVGFTAAAAIVVSGDGSDEPTEAKPAAARVVTVRCADGGPGAARVDAARDAVLGPLAIIGGRANTAGRPDAFRQRGYKLPVTIPRGATVTLSVPRELRGRVGLVFTLDTQSRVVRRGVRVADPAVRFQACQRGEGGRTGWPGGIAVDRRRCASLLVAVAGSAPTRHRVPLGRAC